MTHQALKTVEILQSSRQPVPVCNNIHGKQLYLNKVSHFFTFLLCISSYHCTSLRGLWLHLLYIFQLVSWRNRKISPSLPLPSHLLIFHVFHFPGNPDGPSMDSFLYFGKPKNWHHTPDTASRVSQRWKITSLELLDIFMLIQRRKWSVFNWLAFL